MWVKTTPICLTLPRGYNPNMQNRKFSKGLWAVLILFAVFAILLALYFIPPIHERLAWRFAGLRSKVFYFFNPPGKAEFLPVQQEEMVEIVNATLTASVNSENPTLAPTLTLAFQATFAPTATPTLEPTQTPIPSSVSLSGVKHEFQKMNNCGPATLSMALSYWGWEGNQELTRGWLRPHPEDRNVMLYEMVDAVKANTSFSALVRYGGDDELIKKFVAAGIPVIIERDMGDVRPNADWTGHYSLITGYDDGSGKYLTQDSYRGENIVLDYENHDRFWRAFNYVFVVIYPPEREVEILAILGPHADITYNHKSAAQKAQEAIPSLEGRDLFFAYFNFGTSLVNLGDYHGAARAYDYAYNEVYPTIPEEARPWRMIWYQTGPYFAYYYMGRYQDVIDLANLTLATTGVREIEETWIWRGRARLALGEVDGAIEDFYEALKYHPGWTPAEVELQNLGIFP